VTHRRILALIAVVTLSSSCSVQPRSANTLWCDAPDPLLLAAQSVPSAQLIPCLESLPLGWKTFGADIDDRGTRFTLDSDIGGNDAIVVELVPGCDVAGFARRPTDEAGTRLYELAEKVGAGYRGQRAYLFEGGCVRISTDLAVDAGAAAVNEASLAISFVPRSQIDEGIREVTDGREQLDPPSDG